MSRTKDNAEKIMQCECEELYHKLKPGKDRDIVMRIWTMAFEVDPYDLETMSLMSDINNKIAQRNNVIWD